MSDTDWKRFLPQGTITIAALLVLTLFIVIIGQAFTEFQNAFKQAGAILLFLFVGLFGLVAVGGYKLWKSMADEKKKKLIAKLFFWHDPEEGVLKSNVFVANELSLFSGSMMIFGILFFFTTINQRFFASIPMRAQQFTASGNLLYNSIFPPVAENIAGGFVIGGLMVLFYWIFVRKLKMSDTAAKIISIIIVPILFAIIWKQYHSLVYGADSIAALYTLIFGYIWSLLVVVTGSFIVGFVIHFNNNYFYAAYLLGLFTNPTFLFFGFFVLELFMGYLFYLSRTKLKSLDRVGG